MANRLVLWDIDQTLIDLHGNSRAWYARAFTEVLGITMSEMPGFFGRTERAITSEVLAAHGITPDEEILRKFWAALVTCSEQAVPTLGQIGVALPGAAEALSTIATRTEVVQSLVTGNLREIAWNKLRAFDLQTHLDFDLGGYGDLSAHRPDLVAYAVDLAAAQHGEVEAVVVIGDTPHDVAAALTHGAVAVGVATGRFDADTLRDAGAHFVLADLSDTAAVLAAVSDSPHAS